MNDGVGAMGTQWAEEAFEERRTVKNKKSRGNRGFSKEVQARLLASLAATAGGHCESLLAPEPALSSSGAVGSTALVLVVRW